jgi:uncharacterized membrane protein
MRNDTQVTGAGRTESDRGWLVLGRPAEDRTFEAVEVAVGVAAGAAIGGSVAGPAGAVVGGIVGAVVGATAGELIERAAGPAAKTMDASAPTKTP